MNNLQTSVTVHGKKISLNIALGKLACVPNLFIIITCCVALVRHFVHHMYSTVVKIHG